MSKTGFYIIILPRYGENGNFEEEKSQNYDIVAQFFWIFIQDNRQNSKLHFAIHVLYFTGPY